LKRVVIFDYNSVFSKDIKEAIFKFNLLFPQRQYQVDIYRAEDYPYELLVGEADMIIHSGGDGLPVKEDMVGIPKLYICYSHQWKAKLEGGEIVRLKDYIKGIKSIDILEDDVILGKRGKLSIMKYHSLAVVKAPACAKVLAISKAIDEDGREREIIEVLRYPDGSMGVQGHPEEGTASHIFYNLLKR